MNERIISIETYNPLEIYGVNDAHLELIKKQFPKLKIVARGDVVKVFGEEEELALFERKFSLLLLSYEKFGKITESDILQIMPAKKKPTISSNRSRPTMCWSTGVTGGLSRP